MDNLSEGLSEDMARRKKLTPSPRSVAYLPPADVVCTTLRELVGSVRPMQQTAATATAATQASLGFARQPAVNASDAEVTLWCVGERALVQRPCVAIVGTRNVSELGAARARRLAKELVEADIVVVSGLAKGVDTEALTSAITHNGRVIAVIGTPIEKAYPAENKRLQEAIHKDHLLVSQFAAGSRVFPSNFPQRNKVMAALCDATVIIEASDSSGTLHQAAECHRLGRWLFIAKSMVEDSGLKWPKKFVGHPRTRVLENAQDLIDQVRKG